MKIVIWGVGNVGRFYLEKIDKNNEIVAIVDSNSSLWGEILCGVVISPPDIIRHLWFDTIVICNNTKAQFVDIYFLLRRMNVDASKISFDAIKKFRNYDVELFEDCVNLYDNIDIINDRNIVLLRDRLNFYAKKNVSNNKRLKVRITCSHCTILNSVASLYFGFESLGVDVMIIMSDYDESNKDSFIKYCNYNSITGILLSEYCIKEDNPDIFIPISFSKGLIDELGGITVVKKSGRYIVNVMFAQTASIFENRIENYYHLKDDTDIVIASPNIVSYLKKAIPNVVGMLNPKLDEIYEKCSVSNKCNNRFRKLKNKKTTLFVVSHGISQNGIIDSGVSFDLYVKDILDYYSKHQDEGLIIRFHYFQLYEYAIWNIWTKEDYKNFCELIQSSSNIVVDYDSSYTDAIAFSDALLCEEICGAFFSYLPTKKPIGVLYRNKERKTNSLNREMFEYFYNICDKKELEEYFYGVVYLGNDYKKNYRENLIKKMIPTFDGKNGQRMAEFIISEFENRRNGM